MILKNTYKTIFLLVFISSCLFCQDTIISVWYIGTRVSGGGPYNHYIEIFNPTEQPINLSEYALIKGHGQSGNVEQQTGWGNTLSNSGVSFNRLPSFTLWPGQSYGISRDVSHESLQTHSDLILEDEGVLSISGDDAVGLFKGEGNLDAVLAATDSIPIDCVGNPYEDPGSSWQVSGQTGPPNSTNTTTYGVTRFAILTRKPAVCFGNAGNWNSSRGCVTDSCTNWITDTPQTTYEESEWDVHACYYPDAEGNNGPGYEPETNPNCDEDILVMEAYTNTCELSENQAPTSEAGPDQTANFSQVVTLDGSGSSDLDGTIESYLWSQISGTSAALGTPNEAITTLTSPTEENILVFSLSITDELGGTDRDTISVLVQNTTNAIGANLLPEELRLIGNFPNPFNPKTKIVFETLKETEVGLSIYNIYGQSVWKTNLGLLEKGLHAVSWAGENAQNKTPTSGIYFYRVIVGDKHLISKMSLIK